MAETVEALIDGGKATAGPPLGAALGPLGVNVTQIVADINKLTRDFDGMKVPVTVSVDPKTKAYEISVGTPPTSELIKSELGLKSGSGETGTVVAGNLTLEQAMKVARMKGTDLTGADLAARTREVLGTAHSAGITCEGKPAMEMAAAIRAGEFDDRFKGA